MKTLKQLERLRKAHGLIKQSNTGTPAEFSKRLHVSERELYRILEYLKELDAKILFSRTSNTYYYVDDFDLFVNVSVKTIVNKELVIIYASNEILKRI
jgi:predicted DNA-binding transcriptional regulator YafY